MHREGHVAKNIPREEVQLVMTCIQRTDQSPTIHDNPTGLAHIQEHKNDKTPKILKEGDANYAKYSKAITSVSTLDTILFYCMRMFGWKT